MMNTSTCKSASSDAKSRHIMTYTMRDEDRELSIYETSEEFTCASGTYSYISRFCWPSLQEKLNPNLK